MMGWPARRLLGVFPANSWLTPRRLGRDRMPQPRQPPGAGTAGRDHSSAQQGRDLAGQPGPRGSEYTGTRHGAHRASPLLPPCARGNRQRSHPGAQPSPAGHSLPAGAGHTPRPGKGLSPWHGGRDPVSFPMLRGSRRHPRTPQLCSFCFTLRLFIGNF